jgi:hypothetical protein
MAPRRCAHPGCGAWAVHGETFCAAHRGRGETALLAAGSDFSAGVLAGERERLVHERVLALIAETGANRAIDTEVGALRLLLLRALAEASLSGDLNATALTVVRLTDAIGRLLKVRQALEGGRASSLEQALINVLIDMGLGNEEEPWDANPPPDDEPGFAATLTRD